MIHCTCAVNLVCNCGVGRPSCSISCRSSLCNIRIDSGAAPRHMVPRMLRWQKWRWRWWEGWPWWRSQQSTCHMTLGGTTGRSSHSPQRRHSDPTLKKLIPSEFLKYCLVDKSYIYMHGERSSWQMNRWLSRLSLLSILNYVHHDVRNYQNNIERNNNI